LNTFASRTDIVTYFSLAAALLVSDPSPLAPRGGRRPAGSVAMRIGKQIAFFDRARDKFPPHRRKTSFPLVNPSTFELLSGATDLFLTFPEHETYALS